MFKLLTVGSEVYPLPAAQYPHIAQVLVPPVETELDPGQLRAVNKINSLDSAVLIHGPLERERPLGLRQRSRIEFHRHLEQAEPHER